MIFRGEIFDKMTQVWLNGPTGPTLKPEPKFLSRLKHIFDPTQGQLWCSNLPNWENQKHNRFFTASNHSLMELILLILTKMSDFLSFCPTIEILYKDVNMFWHHLGHCRHAPD